MIYLGFDVLERSPRGPDLGQDGTSRPLNVFDPVLGAPQVDRPTPAAEAVRDFTWTCRTRADVLELLAFLDARKGRAVPFWIPSWRKDLTLAIDRAAGSVDVTVQRTGYGQYVFPLGPYRRHLALRPFGGPLQALKATNVTDLGNGTEKIDLNGTLSANLKAGTAADSSLLMQLLFVRLEQDLTRIEFTTTTHARATFQVRELPAEVPA